MPNKGTKNSHFHHFQKEKRRAEDAEKETQWAKLWILVSQEEGKFSVRPRGGSRVEALALGEEKGEPDEWGRKVGGDEEGVDHTERFEVS
jgi:hypothetical protein